MTLPYTPHYIADAVKRKRLFSLIDENFQKQIFLVTGQAAQGKTTLVASYLHQSRVTALWVHLSDDDSDHIKFYDRLLDGIQRLFENDGKKTSIAAVPGSILGTQKGVVRYVEGMSIMLQELARPLIIVMDDIESIDPSSSGFQLITGLINCRFEGLKFFLLSRTLPPINIPKLKMAHNIFILNNEDLAFTLDETRLFFAKNSRIKTLDVEKIHRITDGWAGGLTLVSESVRQFKKIQDFPDRISSEVFSFFSQEIYKILPDSIREFLMKTSVLDTIDLEILDRLFESVNSLEILNELEKRNLFIQRIDSGTRRPTFKYHNLFRDFLLQELLAIQGDHAFKSLNRKAGQIFWERKEHETAMNHFLKAGAFFDIIHILKIKGVDYIIKGKMAGLEKWIRRLPEQYIKEDPWLLFFLTLTRRINGGRKNIAKFKKAFSLFEDRSDIRGIFLSVGYLIEAAVFVRQPPEMIKEWIKKGENYLRQMGRKNRFPWARALLWQQIGLGYIAGDGNIPKGVSACKNAVLLGRQIKNSDLVLNASITMIFGYVQAGDFENARLMLSRIQQMIQKGQNPEYRALKSIADIDFALKNAKFDEAKILLDRSEEDIEKFGLIFLYPGFVEAKALHMVYTRQFEEARQMADHLNDFSILEGNDFYKGISHRVKALSFLQEGRAEPADQEIQKALKELDLTKKGNVQYFLTQLLTGIIEYENRALHKARDRLINVLDYFEQVSSDLNLCEACFALGVISWELNDLEGALDYSNRGLEKAVSEHYVFFPLIGEQVLIRSLLVMAAYDKIKPFELYVFSLLEQYPPGALYEQMNWILSLIKKKEKNRAVEAIRPLYKSLLPKIRIVTLGQFNIFCENKRFKKVEGAKPTLLLKSIVLHGSKDIPKEILINDLWPDATPRAGEKNLKINLHRLRKSIESSPVKEFGYSYILQKAGLISLDSELIKIDVDEFLEWGAAAVENEKNNQFKTALECYDKVAQIYKGDYFSEEPYREWMSRKRDLFKIKFIELLQKKARLHEELDQVEKAILTWNLILGIDSCLEPAYQNLMILYADSGRKEKALKIFSQCREILRNDLGTEPDTQTIHIYDRIKTL